MTKALLLLLVVVSLVIVDVAVVVATIWDKQESFGQNEYKSGEHNLSMALTIV